MQRLNYILRVYIIPALFTFSGLFILVVTPFFNDIPDIDQTTEVTGTLNSFYTSKWGRGKADYFIILRLNEYSNEFEDNFLNEQLCKKYLVNNKSKVTFRIDNKDIEALNGPKRIGTIGITIDNNVLQTPEQDLKKDTAIRNYVIPIIGSIILIMSYLFYRNGQNNYVKPKHKQTK